MTNLVRINIPKSKIKLPPKKVLKTWTNHCLNAFVENVELDIDFVDEVQSQLLNNQYRGKDKPTNVLSFPLDLPRTAKHQLLGNLVLCLPVIQREAIEQNKTLEDHLAHLLIHGCLHLLGHDHEKPDEAEIMEDLEITLLAELGIENPYE